MILNIVVRFLPGDFLPAGSAASATERVRHDVGLRHPQGRRGVHGSARAQTHQRAAARAPRERRRRRHRLEAVHQQTHDGRQGPQHRRVARRLQGRRQYTGEHVSLLSTTKPHCLTTPFGLF